MYLAHVFLFGLIAHTLTYAAIVLSSRVGLARLQIDGGVCCSAHGSGQPRRLWRLPASR
jgi:hypothetical protein